MGYRLKTAALFIALAASAVGVAWHTAPRSKRQLSERLLWNAAWGDPAEAEQLIAQGADANARDAMGMTPLMWATVQGRSATMKLLLTAGADPALRNNDGYTARMLAKAERRKAKIDILKKAGAPKG